MTESAVVHTDLTSSSAAGKALGLQIAEALTTPPDAVIVFASPSYDQQDLLQALKSACQPGIIIGCSSAGEFTSVAQGVGMACAIALHSTEMEFRAGIGHNIRDHPTRAAQELLSSFRGMAASEGRHRSALILTDALAGHADLLVEQLARLTSGKYQFFGGGAGDNAQFQNTPVFYGTEVVSNAVVALEILSRKPLGIGARHGWTPGSPRLHVTGVNGMTLLTLDDRPAVVAFKEHAARTNQHFDPENPLPFFLHNLIGIETAGHTLRVPLAVNPDGSILCAAEIPPEASIFIMNATPTSPIEAAVNAAREAQKNLYGCQPELALVFDCVATRLTMGKEFGFELAALQQTIGEIQYAGCNSHGQIVRAEGQFGGFHNCTAVVCLFPK